MKKVNTEKMKRIVKKHPVSSALAFLYTLIFIVQGNTEVFLAGIAAALGACILEILFPAAETLHTRKRRISAVPSRNTGKQTVQAKTGQASRENAAPSRRRKELYYVQKNAAPDAGITLTRIRQKIAA